MEGWTIPSDQDNWNREQIEHIIAMTRDILRKQQDDATLSPYLSPRQSEAGSSHSPHPSSPHLID